MITPSSCQAHLMRLNQIIVIRPCDFMFPFAIDVMIYLNDNLIENIYRGVFHFPMAKSVKLYLDNNRISKIHPNTFVHGRHFLKIHFYNFKI